MKRTQPFIVTTADRLEYSDCVNEYRRKQMTAMAEARGLCAVWLKGQWLGEREEALLIDTPSAAHVAAALDLAKHFDQEYVCVVNADSSAYQHKVDDQTETFKGYWKSVPKWREQTLMDSGADYTYDYRADTYWVVGS